MDKENNSLQGFELLTQLGKDNQFNSLPKTQQEEYLQTLMKNPEVRINEMLHQAERSLSQDDIPMAKELLSQAEEAYKKSGLDNKELDEMLIKYKEAVEQKENELTNIAKETREKTEDVL